MYKITKLMQSGQRLFHTQDLAVLWGVEKRNSLYTTIRRYVEKGVLFPVFKGLYATVPVSEIGAEQIGMAVVHDYAYVSCETVLAREGIIAQAVYPLTLVAGVSKRFKIKSMEFVVRRIKPEFLFNTAGMSEAGGVLAANKCRAVADILYFNSKYHFDAGNGLNWDEVKAIQKEVGYI